MDFHSLNRFRYADSAYLSGSLAQGLNFSTSSLTMSAKGKSVAKPVATKAKAKSPAAAAQKAKSQPASGGVKKPAGTTPFTYFEKYCFTTSRRTDGLLIVDTSASNRLILALSEHLSPRFVLLFIDIVSFPHSAVVL